MKNKISQQKARFSYIEELWKFSAAMTFLWWEEEIRLIKGTGGGDRDEGEEKVGGGGEGKGKEKRS
jgi:hypothetical protein